MRSWTYSQLKTKIQNDLDLSDEDFISTTELLAYVNEAIDDCEAIIHTLYEDYFLSSASISLVSGTAAYSLPSDIYANKIRKVLYDNGSNDYEITRIKRLHEIPSIQSDDDLRYVLINTSASGYQIKFYPTPAETDSDNVTIWYLRNAKQLTADADVLDIPEFANYVMQHAKVRCYEKEGHPNLLKAVKDLEDQKSLMIETLTNMVDDENNQIDMDLSFYADFDSGSLVE